MLGIMFIILSICSVFRGGTNMDKVIQFYKNPQQQIPKLDVYKELDKNAKISRIIHQTAPSDKSKWHPIWEHCQASWKRNFPTYEYKMWTDEDNDTFIKTKFNWFYSTYKGFKKNIMRIDAVRYFILYEYGGIYADMDFECLKNFEHILPKGKVSIAETQHQGDPNEKFQNALMCSPPKHPFWLHIILNIYTNKDSDDVLLVAGPRVVDKTVYAHPDIVFPLEHKLFAPVHSEDFKYMRLENKEQMEKNLKTPTDAYTRHHGTSVWI